MRMRLGRNANETQPHLRDQGLACSIENKLYAKATWQDRQDASGYRLVWRLHDAGMSCLDRRGASPQAVSPADIVNTYL
jgi:hypothetical protein